MREVGRIVVFVTTFISCNALLDLSGVHQVTATWMGSTTVPCIYVPSEGFTQQRLSWILERDSSTSTILRRDETGDHILLSKFRGRVSVPKNNLGDVSLHIENLEMPDSGHYTCQVIWKSTDNSLITREVTTTLKVVKVAATKPIIRAGELGLTVPPGASTSLTCEASGSPPINYRWYRGSPAGKPQFLTSGAELAWGSLQPSDSGTYFCEAENRAGDGAVQRSDAVQLTVTGKTQTEPVPAGTSGISWTPRGPITTADLPTTTVALQRNVGTTGGHHSTTGQGDSGDMEHTVTHPVPTTRVSRMDTAPVGPFKDTGSPRVGPSPLLYGPAAALGGAALGALLAVGLGWWCRRRRKEAPLYEVAFHSIADVALLHTEVEVPVKCQQEETHSNTEKTTVKDKKSPEYENLVTAMESQYETEGI